MGVWNYIWAVIRREFRIIQEHPIYIFGSVGVMLFIALFFFTFFKGGLPQDLPIGVVDNDNSSVSRNFRRQSLSMITKNPCQAPQRMKETSAPCHRPVRRKTIPRLT